MFLCNFQNNAEYLVWLLKEFESGDHSLVARRSCFKYVIEVKIAIDKVCAVDDKNKKIIECKSLNNEWQNHANEM